MNFLLIVVLLGGVFVSALPYHRAPRGASEALRNRLENLKQQMPCGFPNFNKPPLAPYKSEKIKFDINNDIGQAIVELINLRIDGLNDFDIDDIKFSPLTLRINFNLNFNELSAQSQYNLNASKPITHSSKGDLDLKLTDLRLEGSFKFGARLSGVQVKHFELVGSLGDAESNISGIVEDEETNEYINELVEEYVVDIIIEKMHDNLLFEANKILAQYSLGELIGTLAKPSPQSTCVAPKEEEPN